MRIGIVFLLIANLFACGSYKTPQQAGTRIELSEGGGFTGKYETWYLLDNGQVFFKSEQDTAFIKGQGISKKKADTYFKKAEYLFIGDKKTPSTALNYSRSIQLFNQGKKSIIIWSPGDLKYEKYNDLYMDLMLVLAAAK